MSSILTDRIICKAKKKADQYLMEHKNDCVPMYDFYIGETKRVWKIWDKMSKIKSFGNLEGESQDKLVSNAESVLEAYHDVRKTRNSYQHYRL